MHWETTGSFVLAQIPGRRRAATAYEERNPLSDGAVVSALGDVFNP